MQQALAGNGPGFQACFSLVADFLELGQGPDEQIGNVLRPACLDLRFGAAEEHLAAHQVCLVGVAAFRELPGLIFDLVPITTLQRQGAAPQPVIDPGGTVDPVGRAAGQSDQTGQTQRYDPEARAFGSVIWCN